MELAGRFRRELTRRDIRAKPNDAVRRIGGSHGPTGSTATWWTASAFTTDARFAGWFAAAVASPAGNLADR
jgi:hypothetical protein